MIRSFSDQDTEPLFHGQRPRKLPNDIWKRGTRKLLILHAATAISELRVPPGNRLEKLRGIGKENTASESTINGEYVLFGVTVTLTRFKLQTVIPDLLR